MLAESPAAPLAMHAIGALRNTLGNTTDRTFGNLLLARSPAGAAAMAALGAYLLPAQVIREDPESAAADFAAEAAAVNAIKLVLTICDRPYLAVPHHASLPLAALVECAAREDPSHGPGEDIVSSGAIEALCILIGYGPAPAAAVTAVGGARMLAERLSQASSRAGFGRGDSEEDSDSEEDEENGVLVARVVNALSELFELCPAARADAAAAGCLPALVQLLQQQLQQQGGGTLLTSVGFGFVAVQGTN